MAFTSAHAEETASELAKASLNALKVNHFSRHLSLPLEQYYNFNALRGRTQSITYFKPVIPFHLGGQYDLIMRTIAPVIESTPANKTRSNENIQTINGWGDLNPTFFITPSHANSFIVGFGPTFTLPTSTNSQYIGAGKWSSGPELVVYWMDKNWVIGILTNNEWSFAGDPNRPAVDDFQLEYLISYVFDTGWYIRSNPTITANWKADANKQWTVPFGIGTGRVIKLQSESINIGILTNFNAIRPQHSGPNWQLQLQLEWLFDPVTMS